MNRKNPASGNNRGLAQVTFLLCILVWQTFPALIGMMLFILLVRVLRVDWRWLAGIGGIAMVFAVLLMAFLHQLAGYIETGWQINMQWWKMGLSQSVADALRLSFGEGLFYVLSVPFPMVGLMALMELIPASAHERQLKALQRGNASGSNRLSQKSSSSLERTLERVSDEEHDGTVLGVSASSGKGANAPSVEDEKTDPVAADRVYTAWSTYLRVNTRDTKKYPLLFRENVNYGYRRNVFGLRSVGIIASIVSCVLSAIWLYLLHRSTGKLSAEVAGAFAFALVFSLLWVFRFSGSWVRMPADAYAERLAEATDSVGSEILPAKKRSN